MVCASGGKRIGRGGPLVRINLLEETRKTSSGQRRWGRLHLPTMRSRAESVPLIAPVGPRPTVETAMDVDRLKITVGDLTGASVKCLDPLFDLFRGRIYKDTADILDILSHATDFYRGGRINLLMHQIQLNLPQLENETELFSFLAERIIEAGFRRVLFYKPPDGIEFNCVEGKAKDDEVKITSYLLRGLGKDDLLTLTLREALKEDEEQVLLQRVDKPTSDPRCMVNLAWYGHLNPLVAVPLVANNPGPQRVMVIWNEQGETLGFDNHACAQFIILARMIGARLGEI